MKRTLLPCLIPLVALANKSFLVDMKKLSALGCLCRKSPPGFIWPCDIKISLPGGDMLNHPNFWEKCFFFFMVWWLTVWRECQWTHIAKPRQWGHSGLLGPKRSGCDSRRETARAFGPPVTTREAGWAGPRPSSGQVLVDICSLPATGLLHPWFQSPPVLLLRLVVLVVLYAVNSSPISCVGMKSYTFWISTKLKILLIWHRCRMILTADWLCGLVWL